MVVHLGSVLDVPLRDRNAMLAAAGFAPVYAERSLDDPELVDVRAALDTMLAAHHPFPAYIVDRGWNLMAANEAAGRLIGRLPAPTQLLAGNIARLVCHPDGLRRASSDWEVAAGTVLRRVQSERAAHPTNTGLADLFEEISSYPDAPDGRTLAAVPSAGDLLIPLRMTLDDRELAFYTTITALLSPCDITLEELRLETLLPADPTTTAFLSELASGSPWSEGLSSPTEDLSPIVVP
jgi:hypothetical protein